MKEKKYNLVKALSWYTIGSVLIKSINFFTLRIFTNIINTSDFGVYGVYQSYLAIFGMIILVGTAHSIKMVKYDEDIDYNSYVSSVIYIPIIGTICFLVITQYVSCFISSIADLPINMWQILFMTAGIDSVVNIISSKLILEGEYKIYIASSLINSTVNVGLSIVLCYMIYSGSNAYWARIYGGLAAGFTNALFFLFFFKPENPRFKYIKKGVMLGLPLLVHSIGTQVLVQSDKIVISQMCSYSEVGIYTAAVNIVVIPTTLLGSVEHSWSPWYYESLSKQNYQEIVRKNTAIVSLFGLGIVLFMLGSPEVVRLMTSMDYWKAIYVLIPLTLAVFAELIYIIPLNLELYNKDNNAIWIYTVSAVVFNIIFDIVFIKIFGFLAGAYVTCASRFLLFLLHYYRAKKIDANGTLNLKVVVLLIVCLIITNVATVVLADYCYIRWGCILLLSIGSVVFLFMYRKCNSEV